MSDWDAIRTKVEARQKAAADFAARAEAEASSRRDALEDKLTALRQRLSQFSADLAGNLHVSISETASTQYGMDSGFDVALCRRPMGWILPDRTLRVGVSGKQFAVAAPDRAVSYFDSIEDAIDELTEHASEIVSDPNAPNKTRLEPKLEAAKNIAVALYWTASAILGVGAALLTWISVGQNYGLIGALLGWIPGIIIGYLVALFWGVAAVLAILYLLFQIR
jgi:hypothetical protein